MEKKKNPQEIWNGEYILFVVFICSYIYKEKHFYQVTQKLGVSIGTVLPGG